MRSASFGVMKNEFVNFFCRTFLAWYRIMQNRKCDIYITASELCTARLCGLLGTATGECLDRKLVYPNLVHVCVVNVTEHIATLLPALCNVSARIGAAWNCVPSNYTSNIHIYTQFVLPDVAWRMCKLLQHTCELADILIVDLIHVVSCLYVAFIL